MKFSETNCRKAKHGASNLKVSSSQLLFRCCLNDPPFFSLFFMFRRLRLSLIASLESFSLRHFFFLQCKDLPPCLSLSFVYSERRTADKATCKPTFQMQMPLNEQGPRGSEILSANPLPLITMHRMYNFNIMWAVCAYSQHSAVLL